MDFTLCVCIPNFGGSHGKRNKAQPGKCQLGFSHPSNSGAVARAGRERESSAPLEPSGHNLAANQAP